MIYPKSVNKGDTIKLISPSNGTNKTKLRQLDSAIEVLKSRGFNIEEDKYTRCSNNGISSDSFSRANELNESFLDSSKALIAVSGGDFINQIMDKLEYNHYLNNIKWLQGQSDITVLLYYLTTYYDIATIYSFNARGYSYDNTKTIEYCIDALKNKLIEEESINDWQTITPFKNFKGRIIGGCLESIKDIIGTEYDGFKQFEKKYITDGIIWYFDIATFTNEDISRTMWQLKSMGYFKYCKGILFGIVEEEKSFINRDLKSSILGELGDLNIPIIIDCDLGHTKNVITIVNGSIVKIKKEKNKYTIQTIEE